MSKCKLTETLRYDFSSAMTMGFRKMGSESQSPIGNYVSSLSSFPIYDNREEKRNIVTSDSNQHVAHNFQHVTKALTEAYPAGRSVATVAELFNVVLAHVF